MAAIIELYHTTPKMPVRRVAVGTAVGSRRAIAEESVRLWRDAAGRVENGVEAVARSWLHVTDWRTPSSIIGVRVQTDTHGLTYTTNTNCEWGERVPAPIVLAGLVAGAHRYNVAGQMLWLLTKHTPYAPSAPSMSGSILTTSEALAVLGITDSTPDNIKRAFRQRLRELHPDCNAGRAAGSQIAILIMARNTLSESRTNALV